MSLSLFNKREVTDYIHLLPMEIQRSIFYFIPYKTIRRNETKLIKNIIDVYSIDHNDDITRMARLYLMKNIMSFSDYVFTTLYEEKYNGSDFGRDEYDTLELSSKVIYELNN
jgi:hypothetical protein